jgi:hypothetical protein
VDRHFFIGITFLQQIEKSDLWFISRIFIPLLVLEEMELEWSGDKGNEVVRDRRIVPIIFHLAYRWIKKASEPQRLCFSFFLSSSFLLTRSTHTLCTKSGIRWSRSVSLSLSHKESRSKFREDKWARINCWDHAWGSGLMDFHGKGDVAHVRTSKTLAFWRRRNNKFTASTIKPRFAFDF